MSWTNQNSRQVSTKWLKLFDDAPLTVSEPVSADSIVVSSTKIREFLLEGNVEGAALLLGRPHDVDGVVGTALQAHPWECVTVGGGLRHSDDQVELLEHVINLIRRHAPDAAIAFNSSPATTYEAAARWINCLQ